MQVSVLPGLIPWRNPLESAVWHVDAGSLTDSGDGLRDLTGGGRDAIFGAGAAAPMVLPWDGEDYIWLPQDWFGSPDQYQFRVITTTNARFTNADPAKVAMEMDLVVLNGAGNLEMAAALPGVRLHRHSDGRIGARISTTGNGWQYVWSDTVWPVGTRHTVRVETDLPSGDVRLYLDGDEIGSETLPSPLAWIITNDSILGNVTNVDEPEMKVYSFRGETDDVPEQICTPGDVSTDYTTITNTGTAGGTWSINRGGTGFKTAVVNRPILLFGGGQAADVADSKDLTPDTGWSVVTVFRAYGTQPGPGTGRVIGTKGASSEAGFGIQRTPDTATVDVVAGLFHWAYTLPAAVSGETAVGLTYTPGELAAFQDGARVITGDRNVTGEDARDLQIGAVGSGNPVEMEFLGAAIFDRALTDEEVALASEALAGNPRVEDRREWEVVVTDVPTEAVRMTGLVPWSDPLESAVWHVDARSLTESGDGLADLTGSGRDAVFGAAAPLVLPWDGADYAYVPAVANNGFATPDVGVPQGATLRLTFDFAWLSSADGVRTHMYSAGPDSGNVLFYDDGQVYLAFGRSSALTAPAGTIPGPDGQRRTIVIETDAATAEIWVDGVSVWTGSFSTPGEFTGVSNGNFGLQSSNLGERHWHRFAREMNGVVTDELLPSNVAADYATIANTGAAGGDWIVARADMGSETVVVDRPLLYFAPGSSAATAQPLPEFPDPTSVTVLIALRMRPRAAVQMILTDRNTYSDDYGWMYFNSANRYDYLTLTGPDDGFVWPDNSNLADHNGTAGFRLRDGVLSFYQSNAWVNDRAQSMTTAGGWSGLYPLRIAAHGAGGGGRFEFLAAAIWDRALTDAEVALASEALAGSPRVEDRREWEVRVEEPLEWGVSVDERGQWGAQVLEGYVPPPKMVRDWRHGTGSQAPNVPYQFDLAGLTGQVYLFHYRNQNLGAVDEANTTGMELVSGTGPGSGRMTVWRVTSDTPAMQVTGNNALVSWTAVEVDPDLAYGGSALGYAGTNATPEVSAPADGGARPTLVCYGCNNNSPWVQNGDEPVRADDHTEVRPATMTAFFNEGPPPDGDRGGGGTLSRIEGSGVVWF